MSNRFPYDFCVPYVLIHSQIVTTSMSTQKGNVSRSRPQKHKNSSAFKNNLYDTSNKTKFINSIQVVNVCSRCKSIIEWKIKYKKYKPLKTPKTCAKCNQKSVKSAYHILCSKCAGEGQVCPKCGKKEELIAENVQKEELKKDADILNAIKNLPERKRRTVLRHLEKRKDASQSTDQGSDTLSKENVLDKIKAMSLENDEADDDFWDDLDENGSDDNESVNDDSDH